MSYAPASLLAPVLQTDSGGGIIFLLIFLVVFLGIIGLWIYATVWIYRDASERGANELIWTIAMVGGGLTFGLLAVGLIALVWVSVRPPVGGEDKSNNTSSDDSAPTLPANKPDDSGNDDAPSTSWDVDDNSSQNDDSDSFDSGGSDTGAGSDDNDDMWDEDDRWS